MAVHVATLHSSLKRIQMVLLTTPLHDAIQATIEEVKIAINILQL